MNKEKIMVLGFMFGMFISLTLCYSVYKETSPPTSAYMPTREWRQFEKTCSSLCSPDIGIIIGEPIPGRVGEGTYCICDSKPPKMVARWR